MTRDEAKEILRTYRPGTADDLDPSFAEALNAVRGDAELEAWFREHCALYEAVKAKLRSIEPPGDLKERIRTGRRVVPVVFRRRAFLGWAAAAAAVLGMIWAVEWSARESDRYSNFRGRMVSMALRQYGMDVVTNRSEVVRNFLAERGAPADYVVPNSLERLTLAGGGALTWRGNPVSMICFEREDRQMLFLFVVNRSAVEDAPAVEPEVVKVNRLMTSSWTRGDRAYLLAGPEEEGFAEKYR